MQTLDKLNNTGEPFIKVYLRNLKSKKLTLPKLLGLFTFMLTTCLMLTAGSAKAGQQAFPMILAANPELENSERNVRDSGGATLTPENQKETRRDLKITKTIRKAIVKQKSLSVNAHNAKIITRNGVVTLRGPVENSDEKTELQSIAEKVRGVKQVDNQLEAKTP